MFLGWNALSKRKCTFLLGNPSYWRSAPYYESMTPTCVETHPFCVCVGNTHSSMEEFTQWKNTSFRGGSHFPCVVHSFLSGENTSFCLGILYFFQRQATFFGEMHIFFGGVGMNEALYEQKASFCKGTYLPYWERHFSFMVCSSFGEMQLPWGETHLSVKEFFLWVKTSFLCGNTNPIVENHLPVKKCNIPVGEKHLFWWNLNFLWETHIPVGKHTFFWGTLIHWYNTSSYEEMHVPMSECMLLWEKFTFLYGKHIFRWDISSSCGENSLFYVGS